jgi:hypothetical protein
MTTRQILREARALLIKGGWIQDTWESFGAHCASGAIRAVVRKYDLPLDVKIKVSDRLQRTIHCNIVSWNDTYGRTQEQVLRAFAKAAR